MVLGEWYDDANSDSEDLEDLVGNDNDFASEFLNEVKPEELNIK
jgi:hypothetical protein